MTDGISYSHVFAYLITSAKLMISSGFPEMKSLGIREVKISHLALIEMVL